MKKLLAIAVLSLFSVSLTAQTRHLKFTNDGAFASVAGSDSLSSFSVQVSRGSANGTTTTSVVLVSSAFSADLTSVTVLEVVGPIPNSLEEGAHKRKTGLLA